MRRPLGLVVSLLVLMSVIAVARPASSHARSVSYSTWRIQPHGATIRLRLSQLDMSAFARPSGRAPDMASLLRLSVEGEPCSPSELIELAADPAWRAFEWSVRCPTTEGAWRIQSDLLIAAIPAHLHFAQVEGSEQGAEVVLGEQRRSAILPKGGSDTNLAVVGMIGRFIQLGVEHITSGIDHLVFLLALALLTRSARSLALLATGFTVGHSITLSLAVLGYANPDGRCVEALIGLSIALVAVENVWLAQDRSSPRVPLFAMIALGLVILLAAMLGTGSVTALVGVGLCSACYFGLQSRAERPERLRLAVTALFGLIHGFGFAGVLAEMDLPPERLGYGLMGFNLGVEIGQLGLLALALLAMKLAQRLGEGYYSALVEWGSAGAVGAGTFWFVTRALG